MRPDRRIKSSCKIPSLPVLTPPRTINFIIDLSGKHQSQHPPIADERPERMRERGRTILLDEEMRGPRQRVPGHERERKQPPLSKRDQCQQQNQRGDRAHGVQQSRGWLSVLAEIVRPEVGE